eukprot:COSAG01_NODE_31524_length_596_cov_0.674044_1_plen_47_part_10
MLRNTTIEYATTQVEVEIYPVCTCFFKQKTAYEIMSGDWSSDVCSSD